MELYLGHVNKQICTLSESASGSDSVRCSTSAYYQNRNRNRGRAVETHHKNYMSRVSSLVSKICFTCFINVVFLNKILIPLNHVTTKKLCSKREKRDLHNKTSLVIVFFFFQTVVHSTGFDGYM